MRFSDKVWDSNLKKIPKKLSKSRIVYDLRRKSILNLFFSYLLPSRSIAEDSGHQETAQLESKNIFSFNAVKKFHNFIISACLTQRVRVGPIVSNPGLRLTLWPDSWSHPSMRTDVVFLCTNISLEKSIFSVFQNSKLSYLNFLSVWSFIYFLLQSPFISLIATRNFEN